MPSFWFVPGLPDNPSHHLILQPVHRDRGFVRTSSVPYGFSFGAISGMEGDGRVKEGRAEDQEDQGTLKQLGGVPPASFILPWSSWPSFWLSPRLPDNPTSHLILQPVQRDPGFPTAYEIIHLDGTVFSENNKTLNISGKLLESLVLTGRCNKCLCEGQQAG